MDETAVITYRPQLDDPGERALTAFARALAAADVDLRAARDEALERAGPALKSAAAVHVLHDLAAQGWRVAARGGVFEITKPSEEAAEAVDKEQ